MATILTIGYGKRSRAELIACLKEHGVTHLVDVRSAPFSEYHTEFNKPELAVELPRSGIKYVFLGESLGGRPSDNSCYDEAGRVVYDQVESLPAFKKGIKQVIDAADTSGRKLCLMCSESKPEQCHRSKLIGKVLKEIGVVVEHINERGSLDTQAEVMTRVDDGQLNLFGDSATSKKSYLPSSK